MAQTITPSLWFAEGTGEAIDHYVAVFDPVVPGGARVTATSHYPTEGLSDAQKSFAGQVLTVDFEIGGVALTAINGGPAFRPNPAISFSLALPDRAAVTAVWAALSDGGRVLMELGPYPFSELYGWVEDRHGVSWQLALAGADAAPGPAVTPSLLFTGDAVGRAEEALRRYVAVFGGAVGTLALYPEPTGPAAAGDLMYGDAQVGGSRLAAMDSGAVMDTPFSPAISFVVACDGQEELDRVWSELSRVPEAERCGWCQDEFGVSWQVVPSNLGDLLQRPGAYAALMGMGRIVIADL